MWSEEWILKQLRMTDEFSTMSESEWKEFLTFYYQGTIPTPLLECYHRALEVIKPNYPIKS